MKIDFSAIGCRIQRRRRQQKKTQDDLAEALSVSVGYISQIERGVTKVSLETLAGIADFLHCGIGELVEDVSPEQKNYLGRELALVCDAMDERQRKMLLEIAMVLRAGASQTPAPEAIRQEIPT